MNLDSCCKPRSALEQPQVSADKRQNTVAGANAGQSITSTVEYDSEIKQSGKHRAAGTADQIRTKTETRVPVLLFPSRAWSRRSAEILSNPAHFLRRMQRLVLEMNSTLKRERQSQSQRL